MPVQAPSLERSGDGLRGATGADRNRVGSAGGTEPRLPHPPAANRRARATGPRGAPVAAAARLLSSRRAARLPRTTLLSSPSGSLQPDYLSSARPIGRSLAKRVAVVVPGWAASACVAMNTAARASVTSEVRPWCLCFLLCAQAAPRCACACFRARAALTWSYPNAKRLTHALCLAARRPCARAASAPRGTRGARAAGARWRAGCGARARLAACRAPRGRAAQR